MANIQPDVLRFAVKNKLSYCSDGSIIWYIQAFNAADETDETTLQTLSKYCSDENCGPYNYDKLLSSYAP